MNKTEANVAKGRPGIEMIALCSGSQENKAQPLLFNFFLTLFQPPPLLCLSFESPANSVSVFCMLPWLFLEPDVLCYLPVRPTNSGCCLCLLLYV